MPSTAADRLLRRVMEPLRDALLSSANRQIKDGSHVAPLSGQKLGVLMGTVRRRFRWCSGTVSADNRDWLPVADRSQAICQTH